MAYSLGRHLDLAVERRGALESRPFKRQVVVYRPFGDKHHGDIGNFVYLRVQQKERSRIQRE